MLDECMTTCFDLASQENALPQGQDNRCRHTEKPGLVPLQAKLINGRSRRQAGSESIVPQKHTPLELQVVEFKKKYPGLLLIIEASC